MNTRATYFEICWNGTKDRDGTCPSLLSAASHPSTLTQLTVGLRPTRGHVGRTLVRYAQTLERAQADVMAQLGPRR